MKNIKRAFIVGLLAMLLAVGIFPLVGCGGSGDSDADKPVSTQEPSSEPEQEEQKEVEEIDYQPGMPLTLTAQGKTFNVESYEITTNDETGNTVVKLHGPDFEMGNDWRDNMDTYLCFSAECEAGGQVYPALSLGVQNMTSYSFEFEAGITPETLVVFPKDEPDKKTTISLKG